MRYAAHFPAQTHFTNGQCFFRYRQIQQTGRHCQADRQIAGSLVQFQTANDVDIHILVAKHIARALFQHCQQHRRAVHIKASSHPPRVAKAGFGHQRLYLHQNGPGTLHQAGNAASAAVQWSAGKQCLAGIRHLAQPVLSHLKNADLVGGAKAIFIRPQDAVAQVFIPLKVKDCIHHMLQHLRARNIAVLVHMPHNEQRDFLSLTGVDQQHSRFSHLRNTAR